MKRSLYSTLGSLSALLLLIFSIAQLRADDGQFFDSAGVKIHYIIKGQGEPLVLIHGYTANIQNQWGTVLESLSKDFKVIAFDNRGHGQSDKPHDPRQYGPVMVEDVVRLMDHLKIEKAHIAGYSMGGFITMKMLEMHPDRMLSAMPCGAGWSKEGGTDPNPQFLDELADSLENGTGITPLIKRLTPPGRPPMSEEQLKNMNAMLTANSDVHALAACARGMKGLTVKEATLKSNKVPTLAIIGEIDPLKAGVDAMNGVMTNLEVKVIPGSDHMTAFTNAAFGPVMKEFLVKTCHCACVEPSSALATSAVGD